MASLPSNNQVYLLSADIKNGQDGQPFTGRFNIVKRAALR